MRRVDPAYEEMKETFKILDENGSGSIELDEFMALMRDLDHTLPAAELRAQFSAIDSNRDGRVSFDEFQAWFGTER
jgi:Ca2+-binding EF-hand superfamily protein